ncbi:MAG TPA: class I SAM-dependent methyltransferase [Streptosporangiaceae bacterium]|jgi:SAM-dependent methyltransferase
MSIVTGPRTFEDLIAEGAAAPVEGWDFSWFAGRATEERPPWGYARRLGERLRQATAALDVQTGGGEVVATALADGGARPAVLAATESWPPNLALARRALAPYGGQVAEVADEADLPFGPEIFDLVSSRHPTTVRWPEIARVLRPGGSYFSQQIGTATNRELFEFMMGPLPEVGRDSASERAVTQARRAGLEVVDLREQALRVEFFDVAAVVVFLRKVIWTVPDFTVDRYLARLARMHEVISASGPFVSFAQRFLIDARKPGPATAG